MNTREPTKLRVVVLAGLAALVALAGAGAVRYTSQPSFCSSCHEMKGSHEGWTTGIHYQTSCYACHVERGLQGHVTAKVNGMRQLYTHFAGKVDMKQVKAEVPSHRCLACHDMAHKEKLGERIVTAHQKHIEAKLQCTVCHINSGHSREVFAGFGQESCKECHSTKPQESPDSFLKRRACTRPWEL